MESQEVEYPAAHSMDTEWFAVDRDGRVAVFDTGESGHAPEGINSYDWGGAADYDLLDWYFPPGSPGGSPSYDSEDVPAELARLGVFFFFYEVYEFAYSWAPRTIGDVPFYGPYGLTHWDLTAPYIRALMPATLLHVDQLPPGLRRRARRHRLTAVSFAEREYVQPTAYLACDGWGYGTRLAYLADDGKTFRPMPGREGEFAEFRRTFLAADPRRAEWFVFDGPTGESHDPPG
jgi:hypothetical protein